MELRYDLWHLAFANLMEERAPPSFQVESEVRLSIEPQRADLLLLRRRDVPARDEEARILRWVWPHLGQVTLVEFKSPTRSSYRRGDLIRLMGYGPVYHASHLDQAPRRKDLTLLLILPSLTPTLLEDLDAMEFVLEDVDQGYRRVRGMVYDTYVALTDEVSKAEQDVFLKLFSRLPGTDLRASLWLDYWLVQRAKIMDKWNQRIEEDPEYEEMHRRIQEDPEYEEVWRKAVLRTPVALRLEGVEPEERLAGLTFEQQILALPEAILRMIPEDQLATLSPEVYAIVKRRLGRGERSD